MSVLDGIYLSPGVDEPLLIDVLGLLLVGDANNGFVTNDCCEVGLFWILFFNGLPWLLLLLLLDTLIVVPGLVAEPFWFLTGEA